MKGMNLAEMKKVAEDKHSAIFRHKDGHEIKIAISALSPKMRKELSSLPVHAAEGTKEPLPHALPAPEQPADDVGPDIQSSQDSYGAAQMRALQNGKVLEQQPAAAATPGASGSWDDSPSGLAPAAPAPQPQQGLSPKQQRQPAQSKTSLAPPPAPPENSYQPGQEPQPQQQEQQLDPKTEMLNEAQAWHNDLNNGHITPETYKSLYAKKDTLGKIGTLFGLMVGGAGAGLSHQPNALLEMMNKQIDNDLKAQTQSKDNAMNYLRLTQQRLLNDAQIKGMNVHNSAVKQDIDIKAYGLARMKENIGAVHNLAMQVQKYSVGSPQRQQAENTLAMMYQALSGENSNIADKAVAAGALANFGNAGGSQPEQQFQQQNRMLKMSGNEALAKDREEKHIPGIQGQSSVNVDKADREKIRNMEQFDKTVQDVRSWAKKHSGVMNQLNFADKSYGTTQLMNLQSLYREGQGMGQLKGFDVPLLEKEIGTNPMSVFNSITNDQKLKAAQDANRSKLMEMKKSLGLPNQAHGQYSPGSLIEYKGARYRVGADGNSLTPVK